jgi:D-glycero-D-manno-heptose 1,7-bisphosphate phosphatase
MRPGAFFDRDGVLNQDGGYVYRAEDWHWQVGAIEALELCREQGYAVIVVTNQSGVGRGFYTDEDVTALHRDKLSGLVDAVYYCPHSPDDDCECRKPRPGMIESAIRDLGLDRARSFLIGDNDTDLLAAEAAHIPGYLYRGGNLLTMVRGILKLK